MVRLYKEQFGRGPTQARTHWCGPDIISVVLEDTLSPAERNLTRMGEHERLREMRMFLQYAPVTLETFVLHSKGYTGPSRTERVTS